jgi:hypothetical protein
VRQPAAIGRSIPGAAFEPQRDLDRGRCVRGLDDLIERGDLELVAGDVAQELDLDAEHRRDRCAAVELEPDQLAAVVVAVAGVVAAWWWRTW